MSSIYDDVESVAVANLAYSLVGYPVSPLPGRLYSYNAVNQTATKVWLLVYDINLSTLTIKKRLAAHPIPPNGTGRFLADQVGGLYYDGLVLYLSAAPVILPDPPTATAAVLDLSFAIVSEDARSAWPSQNR